MAKKDSITIIEGERPKSPPAGCVFVCPMCRQAELGPGEKLCSACTRGKDYFNECLRDSGERFRQLKDLIDKVYGLAKVVEAGKVPRPKEINRIGRDLARWEAQFNCFWVELVTSAVTFGQRIDTRKIRSLQ
jgi:hypothetical protein